MSTTDIKKLAEKLSKMGRYGDTELVHLNKEEKKIIEKYRGDRLSINPKTGLKEGFISQAAGAIISHQMGQLQQGAQGLIKKQQIKEQKEELDKLKKIQPREAQAMSRLREASRKGSIDTTALNRQISQPMYQQGQSQQARQLGQMTRQGLEGSIVAQEVSRKLDSNVRASIAEQAKQIAFKNEQSKIRAQESLQKALFKRGDLLRKIAAQKEGLDKDTVSSRMQSQLNQLTGTYNFGQQLTGILGEGAQTLGDYYNNPHHQLLQLQGMLQSGEINEMQYNQGVNYIQTQNPQMELETSLGLVQPDF